MKILGIEHVAIAVNDLGDTAPLFKDILKIPNSATEDVEQQRVVTDIYNTGAGKIELLEATSDDSPISGFLARRGPGMHHIALRVDNLEDAIAHCMSHGIRMIDESPRIGAEGLRIAFLHPKSTGGVLIELCEKP